MLNSATLNVLVLTSESKRKKFGDVIAIKKRFQQPTTFTISLLARIWKKGYCFETIAKCQTNCKLCITDFTICTSLLGDQNETKYENRNNLMDRGSI